MKPETMMIDDVKYVREDSIKVFALPDGDFSPWETGEEYHIETATKYYLGRLILVTDKELVVDGASWVADTGRFNEYLSGSNPSENEPYQKGSALIISRGALVSAVKREIIIEVI